MSQIHLCTETRQESFITWILSSRYLKKVFAGRAKSEESHHLGMASNNIAPCPMQTDVQEKKRVTPCRCWAHQQVIISSFGRFQNKEESCITYVFHSSVCHNSFSWKNPERKEESHFLDATSNDVTMFLEGNAHAKHTNHLADRVRVM